MQQREERVSAQMQGNIEMTAILFANRRLHDGPGLSSLTIACCLAFDPGSRNHLIGKASRFLAQLSSSQSSPLQICESGPPWHLPPISTVATCFGKLFAEIAPNLPGLNLNSQSSTLNSQPSRSQVVNPRSQTPKSSRGQGVLRCTLQDTWLPPVSARSNRGREGANGISEADCGVPARVLQSQPRVQGRRLHHRHPHLPQVQGVIEPGG
jgi:hypothetical protein